MKILKYKKISRGRYKLTTDTSELVLYEDVILKNNLLYNKFFLCYSVTDLASVFWRFYYAT